METTIRNFSSSFFWTGLSDYWTIFPWKYWVEINFLHDIWVNIDYLVPVHISSINTKISCVQK
jgi:hypothetical protein